MAEARRTRACSRRALLRAALGAAGAAALTACVGGAATPTAGPVQPTATAAGVARATATSARTTTTRLTTTREPVAAGRPASPTPDAGGKVPGWAPGVPDAYLKAPPPFKAVNAVPGRGGRVTTLQSISTPPPTPHDQNPYWQELERRLGVSRFDATLVPGPTYPERLAAVTAGGDLPDLTFVSLGASPEQYQVILQGAYSDLTPYLTGDALGEYANLARYEPRIWKNATIRDRLYGVPRQLENGPSLLALRQDYATKAGLPRPQNADEFLQLMTACTKQDPDGNGQPDTFGLSATSTSVFSLDFFAQVFRAPNGWRLQDGKLTAAVETPEFRQAVTYMRRLFEAGVYHPDAATMTQTQGRDAFVAGRVGAFQIVRTGLPQPTTGLRARVREVSPTGEAVGLAPFGHDGGPGVAHNTPGFAGHVMIPAKVGRDRERVRELLRIVDYFAVPSFSEERTFIAYGIEGIHYERKPDGTLAPNERLKKDQGDLTNITFGGGEALYYPHLPSEAVYMQGLIAEQVAIGIDSPVVAAYAPTEAAKAAELRQLQQDRIGAIVLGREPLGAFEQYVKDWRSRGGDQIRREYEESLKQQ